MAKSKLTKADEKFIAEFLDMKESDFDASLKFIRKNSFTGESFEVNPIVAKCIDLVFSLEPLIHTQRLKDIQARFPQVKSIGRAVQIFDRARYMVMKFDSAAYMGILD